MRGELDAPVLAGFPAATRGGPRSGLRVGITLGARDEPESQAEQGMRHSAVFLRLALQAAANVQSAVLVDLGAASDGTDPLPDAGGQPVFLFDEVRDRLDVLIELGGQVGAQRTEYLKRRGTRLVSYNCGGEYVNAVQSVLFAGSPAGRELFINQRYDAIWITPRAAESSRGFLEVLRHRRADVVPLVWDPMLLEARCQGLRAGGLYRPRQGPARLSVMEPNRDVLRFCLVPVLIAEQAYRWRPEALRALQVTHCEGFAAASAEFIALMGHLDLVRDRKACFVGSHDPAVFLAERTDAVISHQWQDTPDEFHLEACWQGYPLIHNVASCSHLGYYYPGDEVQRGAQVLLEALAGHDRAWEAYRERQRRGIERYLPDNPELVLAYAGLLDELMLCPLH